MSRAISPRFRGTLINRTRFFLQERKYAQKKVVRKGRGRKPNLEVEVSDFCRICMVNFKKNGTYISSENLFTTSKSSGPLSEILSSKLKLFLTPAPNLSSRVCAKCALKIRNASSNFSLVEENLNVPHQNFQESAVEENDDTERFKRCSKSSPGGDVRMCA